MADPHQAAAGGGFSSSGNVSNMVVVGTMREYRKGNWTVPETMVLIEAKKKDDERRQMMKVRHPHHHLSSQVGSGAISGDNHNSPSPSTSSTTSGGGGGSGKQPTELRWKWVEDYCWRKGCFRSQNQCNDKWDNLMRDYKKVRDYQRKLVGVEKEEMDNSYWKMERNERKEKNLPTNMSPLIYEALVHVVEKESSSGGGQQVMMKSMNDMKEAAAATAAVVTPVGYVFSSSSSSTSCSDINYIGQSTISTTMMMISGSTTTSCTSGMVLGSSTTTTTSNKISPTSPIPLPPLIMPQPPPAASISTIPSPFPYIPVIFSSPTMATASTTALPPSRPHLSPPPPPPPPPPPLDSDTITLTSQQHSDSSPAKRRKILFHSSSPRTQPISPKPTTHHTDPNPTATHHHETLPTTPEIDIHQVGAAITKSASVIAEAIRAKQEVEETRHKEIVSLQERRLKIEESKVEMNRQGITGLVQAINNLADSILNLVGKSSTGNNGQQEPPPPPPPPI